MSEQTKEGNNGGGSAKGRVEQDFQTLSLEDKFAILFKMEVAALGEALSLAVNDPMKVLDKVGNKINEFGERIEAEFRRATSTKTSTGDPTVGDASAGSKKANKKQAPPPTSGAEQV